MNTLQVEMINTVSFKCVVEGRLLKMDEARLLIVAFNSGSRKNIILEHCIQDEEETKFSVLGN